MTEIFLLLVLFQLKHFLADYPLQFPYMYENKGKATGWVAPLANHAWIHAAMTLIIGVFFLLDVNPEILTRPAFAILFSITAIDFTTHFIVDRWKATRKGGPDTPRFWINLGLDQMAHHLVGIFIIYILITQGL